MELSSALLGTPVKLLPAWNLADAVPLEGDNPHERYEAGEHERGASLHSHTHIQRQFESSEQCPRVSLRLGRVAYDGFCLSLVRG